MCLRIWLDCARLVALKNLINNSELTCGVLVSAEHHYFSEFIISTDLLDVL